MIRQLHRFLRVLTLLPGLVLLAPALALAQPTHLLPWTHGVLLPKADAGIALMVADGGFARKYGVDLKIVAMRDDASLIRAMLAGDLDSIEGGPGIAIVAASHGAGSRTLGCYWTLPPYGVFARNTIHKVADLRGRTFAISGPGAAPDVVARAILAAYHMKASDVRLANLGGDADRYKAVVAGLADATVVSMEYLPLGSKQGVHLLVASRDVLPDYLRTCITTSNAVLKTKRATAVRFMAAEIAAMHHVVADRAATIALTFKITHLKPTDPRPAFMYDDAVKSHSLDPNVGMHMKSLEWIQGLLVRLGKMPHTMDLTKLVDPSIHADAMKLVRQ